MLGWHTESSIYDKSNWGDVASNALMQKILSSRTLFSFVMGLLGVGLGAFLSWKFERLLVLVTSTIGYLILLCVSTKYDHPSLFLAMPMALLSSISFTSLVLWAIQTIEYKILAAFLVFNVLFYRFNALSRDLSSFDLVSVSSIPIVVFLSLLGAGALLLFYSKRHHLYEMRYMNDNEPVFEDAQNTLQTRALVPNFASSGQRLSAALLDLFFIWLLTLFINMIIPESPIRTIFELLIQLGYFLMFESGSGSTIGKKIVGIEVIDRNGYTPNFSTAFVRTLCRLIPFATLTVLLGGEALHDHLSQTYVVSKGNIYTDISEIGDSAANSPENNVDSIND